MHHIILHAHTHITRNLFQNDVITHSPNIIHRQQDQIVQRQPSTSFMFRPKTGIGKLTFPSALEEEAHNEDLQCGHGNHHQRLDHTEVKDPTLGTAHSTEVSVLTSTEVFLVARDGRKLGGELVDGLLQAASLFGAGTLAGGQLGALLVLNLRIQ